jgi:RNA polymerase sigma factor (sigma-70 family)
VHPDSPTNVYVLGDAPERELTEYIQKGVDKQFLSGVIDQLYRELVPEMVAECTRHGLDCDDAEDLAHEVFEEKVILRRLAEYQPTGSLRAWLRICTRNRCRDRQRHRSRRNIVPLDESDESDRDPSDFVCDLLALSVWEDVYNRFATAASELENEVLLLFIETNDVQEVAERTRRAPTNISKILYKARQKLRKCLEDETHQ